MKRSGAFSVRAYRLRSDINHVAHGNGCEFLAGFGYDLGEHPACSIGGERTIWEGGGREASLMDAAPTTGRPETAAQGDPDAVDDLCDPAGVVAFRAGHLLHARRLHPYPPRYCGDRDRDSSYPRPSPITLSGQGILRVTGERGPSPSSYPSAYCLLYTPRVVCHAGAMQKDFPGWHRHKEQLHAQHQTPTFQEREIWWCSVGVNIGHEMGFFLNFGDIPLWNI
jgi:hypothetical protein